MSEGPLRRIVERSCVQDANGKLLEMVRLVCGHWQLGGSPFHTRNCVECEDKQKYGDSPAPRPPRES